MSDWQTYAVCPGCDSKFKAPHGSAFFANVSGCCPHCGHKKPTHGGNWLTPDWPVRTMRYVSTARVFSPSTWGTGHWEDISDQALLKPEAPHHSKESPNV